MMHQEPLEMARDMLYLGEVIAECIVFVELCQDCLKHDLEDRELKLAVLLDSLHGSIWQLNDDFPYRLAALEKSLERSSTDGHPDRENPHCT